jgi:hypothetical protein
MSAADERVAELLGRWMASVDLHARYVTLDDAAYARAQDWPKHQRPTRWVVELARKRLIELDRLLKDRRARGDTGFAEALELMGFLTALLGTEHVERFIPLAQPRSRPARPAVEPALAPATPVEPTVKSPVLRSGPTIAAPRRTESRAAPTRGPRAAASAPARRKATAQARAASAPTPAGPAPTPTRKEATVIADAVRMLSWGREWPQIAALIARLADRPPEAEVWEILRRHRAEIESRARRPRD